LKKGSLSTALIIIYHILQLHNALSVERLTRARLHGTLVVVGHFVLSPGKNENHSLCIISESNIIYMAGSLYFQFQVKKTLRHELLDIICHYKTQVVNDVNIHK
jgi:hypothetical protein